MIVNISQQIDNQFLNTLDFSNLLPISEGWYGQVFKLTIDGKEYALKRFKDNMHHDMGIKIAAYDYEILEHIGKSEHFPKLHAYKNQEWMIVDFIDGIPFRQIVDKEHYRYQLYVAYLDSVSCGWYPDDVKGNNIVVSKNKLTILDVGSFLPYKTDIPFNILSRIDFVIRHADKYPSIREESPYLLGV